MSGYANYNIDINKYKRHKVPIIIANKSNFLQYGTIFENFDQEEVQLVPWPTYGTRSLMKGTGLGGGIVEDKFLFWEENGYTRAHNLAVGAMEDPYVTGIKTDKSILTREANYHPDGGQVFYSEDNTPFYLLLALPGDQVSVDQFVAFYFDGKQGCQIKPNIWHQPPYPIRKSTFLNKQGAVHGCVGYNSIEEEGCWLEIDL